MQSLDNYIIGHAGRLAIYCVDSVELSYTVGAVRGLSLSSNCGQIKLYSSYSDPNADARSQEEYSKQVKIVEGTSLLIGDHFTGGNISHVLFDHLYRYYCIKRSDISFDYSRLFNLLGLGQVLHVRRTLNQASFGMA